MKRFFAYASELDLIASTPELSFYE